MSQIAERNFKNQVGLKFQLYNSLFTSLPFHSIEKTNIRLMMFLDDCEEGYQQGLSPTQIVEKFFQKFSITNDTKAQTDLLFRFVQYVERQVVLFDAMEDAAFRDINDFMGMGSLKQLETEVKQEDARQALLKKLEDFAVTLVLTAHPTQFYPGTVLGIINDLAKALKDNNTNLVNLYLQQLGKTPLLKKEKPTPYEEAISLVWYLENIFYNAVGRIISQFKSQFKELDLASNPIVKMGFWPGGDRDGNPNVNCDTTLRVADALRTSIIKCYYLDVRKLKRRLTFKGIDNTLALLEQKLYNNVFIPGQRTQLSQQEILESLYGIREVLVNQHDGLFLHLLDDLIHKVEVFGLHFASLDIRQDSSILTMVMEEISKKDGLPSTGYMQMNDQEKMKYLASPKAQTNPDQYEGIVKDSLESFRAISTIQSLNGPRGSCRYIISQCNSALNVMEVYGLFLMNGWQKEKLAI
ncbi:MAG TPA: phosphoenolpyruvate carboxylase, partial [Flavisolibacter sp.]